MIERTRNIGIVAHIDAGKTTVGERFLYWAGAIHRTGEVHDGAAQLDWMEQERERGITITAAATTFAWRGHEVHLLDTPGHVDFTIEVERCLRVLDGCIVVFCGVAGVQAQTETVWRQADRFRVPRLAFVNKLDRAGADFAGVVAAMRERLQCNAVPVQLPLGTGDRFTGVVDLVRMEAVAFASGPGEPPARGPVPAGLQEAARRARERLLAALADLDDGIAAAYLAEREPDAAAFAAALRAAVIGNRLVPVLAGAALRNKGIEPLLDAVVDWLPSPRDLPPVTGHDPAEPSRTLQRAPRDDEPFAALAFKVAMHQGRKAVFLRVFSGRIAAGAQVRNARTGGVERAARLFRMHANARTPVDAAGAGDIVVAAGLQHATTGDTLCAPDAPILLERIDARVPVVAQSIEVEHAGDRDKLHHALAKLADEDPTFRVREDATTGETIVEGMGELHLEIAVDRVRREYGVTARLGRPQVLARLTVRGAGEGAATFERDVEGRHVHAVAACEVRPLSRGSGRSLHRGEAVAAAGLPEHLVAAAMQGLDDGAAAGTDGQPLDDVAITLRQLHSSDPAGSDLAARAAAAEALRRAVAAAGPAALEPIMRVEVDVPAAGLGAVLGDLQQRHGRITAVDELAHGRLVKCLVPLRNLFGYATRLRSLSEGHGTFTMEFARFDVADA